MIEVRKTDVFEKWFSKLTDRLAQRRIQVRIDRLGLGNAGDVKVLGDGVSEMRIDHGPGYRVYFTRRGSAIVILPAGGDKRTQQRDIDAAVDLAKRL